MLLFQQHSPFSLDGIIFFGVIAFLSDDLSRIRNNKFKAPRVTIMSKMEIIHSLIEDIPVLTGIR